MGTERQKSVIPEAEVEHIRALHHNGGAHEYFHRHMAGTYVGDAVFGANDGIITTFAVVAGVAGAELAPAIVLILGVANLLGDGFSMAAGNYLGRKSEGEYRATEHAKELWELRRLPAEERQEVREIYAAKGFQGAELERVVEVLTSNEEVWVNEMLMGEHGIMAASEYSRPFKNALVTFVSFIVAGSIPLAPYIVGLGGKEAFGWAVAASVVALFSVGSLRTRVTERPWWRAGFEMLVVGGVAGVVAYIVGDLLGKIVG